MRISELIDHVAASALPAAFMHQHMPDHALENRALLASVESLDRGRQSRSSFITSICCLYIERNEQGKQNTSGEVAKESKHVKTNGRRNRIIAPKKMRRGKITPRERKEKKNHTTEMKKWRRLRRNRSMKEEEHGEEEKRKLGKLARTF